MTVSAHLFQVRMPSKLLIHCKVGWNKDYCFSSGFHYLLHPLILEEYLMKTLTMKGLNTLRLLIPTTAEMAEKGEPEVTEHELLSTLEAEKVADGPMQCYSC